MSFAQRERENNSAEHKATRDGGRTGEKVNDAKSFRQSEKKEKKERKVFHQAVWVEHVFKFNN
jgi:hypothetical protein